MIRVFIVALSPLVRAGLESLLAARGVEVVGSAGTVDALGSRLSDAEPVFEALAESDLASELALVVLADRSLPGSSAEALRAGVRAVLPSDVSPSQLVAALEAAAVGLVVLHPREVEAVFPAIAPSSGALADLAEPLTRREREVLQRLASGAANKEIAAELAISEHTVKFHIASILGKLGAESRTEAVALGIRRGLVLL